VVGRNVFLIHFFEAKNNRIKINTISQINKLKIKGAVINLYG
jgi:hypothetical protein